ncbi:MAG: Nif3-like dinuclear metal center hexameric protein [Abditibacteriota bacterium]|nr:Nif3-like dinuclear metal center hexameric protein [Abditibacteriota bacterium]
MKLKDLCVALDSKAPEKLYACDGDKVGLFVGDTERDVKKVLTVTDASSDAIDYAIDNNVDMILCHHPFMFEPVGRLTTGDILQNKLYKLVHNDIAVFSMHTNLDSVPGGLNDIFADLLGLKNVVPIETKKVKYYMMVCFATNEYKENILKALFEAGAGAKNNYKDVFFEFKGRCHFTAIGDANPLIGIHNEPVDIEEVSFSVLVSETDLDRVVETYKRVHPYDVPVYYLAESPECDYLPSIGRVGDLEKELTVPEFRELCLKAFELPYARCPFNCDMSKKIKRVGLCSGSGMSLFDKACDMGADAYVCGDIKHDAYLHATDRGKIVLDLGHYETECTSSVVLADYIKDIDSQIETINFEVLRGNKLVLKLSEKR